MTLGRRALLAMTLGATLLAVPLVPAQAQAADAAAVQAPIQRLDDALLATMKSGAAAPFEQRFQQLEPVISQVFDLDAILAQSVGLSWSTLNAAQRAQLAEAFRRYTVSSYLANFDSYNGQSFRILPAQRQVGNGEVIVATQLDRVGKDPVRLDYVMRQVSGAWRVVDVLTDGSISRVAQQRSDFRSLLRTGGAHALAAGLQRKVASLSGGMLG